MARTPLLRNFPSQTESTYTVPTGQHFVGTIINVGDTGSITLGGSANSLNGVAHRAVKPLVLPAGTVVATSSNYGGGYLTGFLEDNA